MSASSNRRRKRLTGAQTAARRQDDQFQRLDFTRARRARRRIRFEDDQAQPQAVVDNVGARNRNGGRPCSVHKVVEIADDDDAVDATRDRCVDDRLLDDAEPLVAPFSRDDYRPELAALAFVHTQGAAQCDAIRQAAGGVETVIEDQMDPPDPVTVRLELHVDKVAANVVNLAQFAVEDNSVAASGQGAS